MANEERWREDRDYERNYGGRYGDRNSRGAYEGAGYGGAAREGGWRGREAARWDQDRSFAPRDYEPERYGAGRDTAEGGYGRGRYGAYGEHRRGGYGFGYGAAYGGGMRGRYGDDGRDAGGFGDGGAYRQGYGGQDVESDGGWFGLGRGDHRGRGPKGYTRSDDRIREDVQDRLSEDPWLDASDIEVQVKDGEITLSGAVESRQAKHRAEHIVEDVSGVKHVQNNLRVREASARTGAASASATTSAQRS